VLESLRRRGQDPVVDSERLRDLDTRAATDGLGADLGEPACGGALEAWKDRPRDGDAEDAVAEEGEPLVGLRAVLDPGGMRERLLGEALRELFE
jgi:hypothetical protein